MNYWVITDTHLGHENIVAAGHRPFGFEDQILTHLCVVNEDDVVIHVGDFAFKRPGFWAAHFFEALPNRVRTWITVGNHDRSVSWFLNQGFDFAGEALMLKWHGRRILFSHEPQEDLGHFDYNIHGHLHKTGHRGEFNHILNDKHILMYMEDDYMPVTLKSIMKGRK